MAFVVRRQGSLVTDKDIMNYVAKQVFVFHLNGFGSVNI